MSSDCHKRPLRRRSLSLPALLVLVVSALGLLGFSCYGERRLNIQAIVRTTSFGIPHIKASNFAGLGYGLGYAYARDNLCILAREIVTARGEEAKFFGISSGRLQRSILFSYTSREDEMRTFFLDQPQDVQDAIHGYAAGYNRWLEETGIENLPEACRASRGCGPSTGSTSRRCTRRAIPEPASAR